MKYPRLGNYPQDASKEELVAYVEAIVDWAAEAEDKIQFFAKWLSLGTPFESAKFDHQKVLEAYHKTFELTISGKEIK